MCGVLSTVLFLLVIYSSTMNAQLRCKQTQEKNSNVVIYGSSSSHELKTEGKPPATESKMSNPLGRKQRTFIRNPNYKSVNEEFDRMAENMFIYELPLPHLGAEGGSTNGCDPE